MAMDDEDDTYDLPDDPGSPSSAVNRSVGDRSVTSPCPSTTSSVASFRRRSRQPASRRRKSMNRTKEGVKSAAALDQEEVDQLMDHSIEIDSNKRIRNEHVSPWTLRFIDEQLETEVRPCAICPRNTQLDDIATIIHNTIHIHVELLRT